MSDEEKSLERSMSIASVESEGEAVGFDGEEERSVDGSLHPSDIDFIDDASMEVDPVAKYHRFNNKRAPTWEEEHWEMYEAPKREVIDLVSDDEVDEVVIEGGPQPGDDPAEAEAPEAAGFDLDDDGIEFLREVQEAREFDANRKCWHLLVIHKKCKLCGLRYCADCGHNSCDAMKS